MDESLAQKAQTKAEFDATIQETEAAYAKILESSQTLLHVLKRESVSLTKKRQAFDSQEPSGHSPAEPSGRFGPSNGSKLETFAPVASHGRLIKY